MIEKLKRARRIFAIAGAAVILLLLIAAAVLPRDALVFVVPGLIAAVIASVADVRKIDDRLRRLYEEENRSKPEVVTPAAVVSVCIRRRYWSYGGHRASMRSTPCWYVTFRTPEHGDVELSVPQEVYLAAHRGKQGNLRFQGWRFISFR